jgi:hypothetical protein
LLLRRGAEVDPQDRWCSTVMQFNLFCFFDYVLVSLLLNHISNDN